MAKDQAAGGRKEAAAKRREKRKGKEAGGGKDKEKKKNPVVQEARTRYEAELRQQGVPAGQIDEKIKAHLKNVVKPAMNEAKEGAKSKNLKGGERKKFIQESVRSKLGLQASS